MAGARGAHAGLRVSGRAALAAAARALALVAALAGGAAAQRELPVPVEVGVWISDIHTVDLLDGSFEAELYLWFVARDEDFPPDDPFRPFETMQILNGRDWSVRAANRRALADGSVHASGYVSVTLNHDWDVRAYPYDRQTLRFVLETPFTASELRLVPNRSASGVSDLASVEGFRIGGLRLDEHVQRYASDFGFRDGAGNEFSRLVVALDLERASERIVVELLVGFFVANLVALLSYAVHVSELGIRCSLAAGAIFGAVGNMYSLHGAVNPAAGSLLVDRVALVTFAGIVVALLTGIVVDRLHRAYRTRLARTVNWSVFALALCGSALVLRQAFLEASAG